MKKVYWYIENNNVYAIYYKTLQLLIISSNLDGHKNGVIYIR